jgi:hypothetical protein
MSTKAWCIPTSARTSRASHDQASVSARWRRAYWTTKSCVICAAPRYELHHASYDQRLPAVELLALVPLCRHHHHDLDVTIWPRVRRWLSRSDAALAYLVHGERLHDGLDWLMASDIPRIGVSADQLSIWGVQP